MSSLLSKKRNGRKKRFSEISAFKGLYVSAIDQAMNAKGSESVACFTLPSRRGYAHA